jgi:hypothetical protein
MNMNPEEKSKIDKLNKSLYSRNAPDIRSNRRLHLEEKDPTVGTDWQHEAEKSEPLISQNYKEKTMSFFTKILITSIVFFCVALGIGTYLVLNGSNIVSANNVDITVNGPLSVSGGEPVSFEVQISNQNNIKLQDINFSVEYPTGTVDAQDSLKSLKNTREEIDDISPGGIGQKTLKAIFYGEENTKKSMSIVIEYKVQGSNATFKKIKTVDLLIASSPLNISISSFKEVNSGQEFELAVSLQSNSKEVIKNVLLKSVYPFGFNFISSDLKTTSTDNSSWKIGDIPPGGRKVVKIKGSLDAQNDESRNFRFSAGSPVLGSDKLIATEYTSGTQEIAIKKPFMTVGVTMNGDSSNNQFVTNFNVPINVSVEYFNNLQTPITDAEIHVKIDGNALDKTAVTPQSGIFRAVDNEIIWNSLSLENLRSIEAGGSGKVDFTVIPRDLSTRVKAITNPNIKFSVSIQGKRKSEKNVPESITSTATREIKVSSIASIGGAILRNSGPFTNTGSIPPRVDQQTTYTAIWVVDNSVNNLSNVQVQSSLPAYVKWLGKVSPESEDLSYDSSTGQLTWNVGSIGTNTIGTVRRRQVAFQISLNPTISQVGQAPVILNQSTLVAEDDFTGASLKSNLGTLNTRFATEAGFKEGDEKVVK